MRRGTRKDVLDVVKAWGENPGGRLFWSWWGYTSRVPWCQIFVSKTMRDAGVDLAVYGNYENCQYAISQMQKKGFWKGKNYFPEPGDLVYYDWQVDGIQDHVGIVVSVEYPYITVREGNMSDKVGNRKIVYNAKTIAGFASPKYAETAIRTDRDYNVSAGDTLSGLAYQFDTCVEKIKKWNGLKNNKIIVGQNLKMYYFKAVCVKAAHFRTKPGTENPDVKTRGKIKKGEKVFVLGGKDIMVKGQKRRWWKILSSDGFKGWVASKKFKKQ